MRARDPFAIMLSGLTMKLLLLALSTLLAQAEPGTRFSCLGHGQMGAIYLEGNLASSGRLEKLAVKDFGSGGTEAESDLAFGIRRPGEAATRFYVRAGTFLMLPDSSLAGVSELLKASDRELRGAIHDPRYGFRMEYVREPRGPAELVCGPKALED